MNVKCARSRLNTLLFVGTIAGLLSLTVLIATAQESQCARIQVRLDQSAIVTRTAFRATLEIGNSSSQPLDDVVVALDIRDADGISANDVFGIADPIVSGITDVGGGGMIPQGTPVTPSTATAQWLIIPTDEAAPTADPEQYTIGGTLSYVTGGNQVTIPLFPAPITVLPDARLFLKYFLQGQVYSDNPSTSNVTEPAETFSLGLLVLNEGFGTARNMHIMGAQPTIVDNQAGLIIAFQLLGTQVGTQELSPSLNVNFGDIGPDQSAVARWRMTSSLQGQFINYDATFEHVNGLGIQGLSLIEAVDIFELNHIVKLDGMGADNLPDFLVNNRTAEGGCGSDLSGAPDDDLPDCVHVSNGAVLPVRTILNATADGPPTEMDQIVMLNVPVIHAGWNYIQLPDPGAGLFEVAAVARLGPLGEKRIIVVGDSGDVSNAWATHRYLPIDGPPTQREDLLRVFDYFGAAGMYEYELTYVGVPGSCNVDADCDDGNPCTVDTCALVIGCQYSDAPAGTTCGDPSDIACDNPDTCDGAGSCLVNHEPDGTPCPDGLVCNGDETCLNGVCTPGTSVAGCCKTDADCANGNVCDGDEVCVNHTCSGGTPLVCDDQNECTVDSCDQMAGCRFDPAATGTACGDRTMSACDRPDSCDGLGSCLANHEREGTPCPDGLHCNGDETCQAGACTPGRSISGCCKLNNDCDNRNPCDGIETCELATHTCVNGTPLVCDDGNLCTTDSCLSNTGCQFANNTNACDDGDPCTVNDTCQDGGCAGLFVVVPYGDVRPPGGDGVISIDDILCILSGFGNPASCPGADMIPCPPNGDGIVSIDDILAVLSAFGGQYACPHPCP